MTLTAVPDEEFVLTDEMKDAITRARFKTTNVPRTHCWIYDSDPALIQATGIPFVAFEREQFTNPGVFDDHEARTNEPLVVAFVGELVDTGRSKRAHDPAKAAIPF